VRESSVAHTPRDVVIRRPHVRIRPDSVTTSASTTPSNLFSRSTSLARIGGGNFQRVDVSDNVDDDSNHQVVIASLHVALHRWIASPPNPFPSRASFEVHPAASLGDSS
jgi:hypothetical protein